MAAQALRQTVTTSTEASMQPRRCGTVTPALGRPAAVQGSLRVKEPCPAVALVMRPSSSYPFHS